MRPYCALWACVGLIVIVIHAWGSAAPDSGEWLRAGLLVAMAIWTERLEVAFRLGERELDVTLSGTALVASALVLDPWLAGLVALISSATIEFGERPIWRPAFNVGNTVSAVVVTSIISHGIWGDQLLAPHTAVFAALLGSVLFEVLHVQAGLALIEARHPGGAREYLLESRALTFFEVGLPALCIALAAPFFDVPVAAVSMLAATQGLVYVALRLLSDEQRQRGKLEREVAVDGLTGVLTRRHFEQRARHRLADGSPDLTLLMIDVDDFKQTNDTHGHLVGDEVLRAVGDVLRSNTRDPDLVARYGGEEFVVLLEPVDEPELRRFLHVVQAEIALRTQTSATVSIGLARYQAGIDLEALTDRADSALYAAKRAGKNVVYHQTENGSSFVEYGVSA